MFCERSPGFLLSWISQMFHFCFEFHEWWTRFLLASSRSLLCVHKGVCKWVGVIVGQALGLCIFKQCFNIKKKTFVPSNYLWEMLLWVKSHNSHKCVGSVHLFYSLAIEMEKAPCPWPSLRADSRIREAFLNYNYKTQVFSHSLCCLLISTCIGKVLSFLSPLLPTSFKMSRHLHLFPFPYFQSS